MGTSLYSMYHDLVEGHVEHYYLLVSIVVALVVAVYCRLRHDGANTMGSRSYGCKHYQNRFRIRAPCCRKIFDCFRCHDELQRFRDHGFYCKILRRQSVKKVICSQCDCEQDVKQVCKNEECGVRMWDHYCVDCKLFYDAYSCRRLNFCCDRCGMKMKSTKEKIVDDKLFVESKMNGCKHYGNRCRLRFGCCNKVFDCWKCHQEEWEAGHFNGMSSNNVVKVICSRCDREQDMKQVCENEGCGASMADYYCAKCKRFFDTYTVRERSFVCRCYENLLISDEEWLARLASSYFVATSSEYYSPRIASIIEERRNNPEMDMVDFEVDASKATWSELGTSAKHESIVEELEAFKSFKKKWPYFFGNGTVTLGAKIAEGGQAEIFELNGRSNKVVKMFKEGWRLVDLEKLIPLVLLKYGFGIYVDDTVCFRGEVCCNSINEAIFVDGRLAFVMPRMWGDLRTIIDARMIHNNMQGPPFSENVTAWYMLQIAIGMLYLHTNNILHRDLKTANVLVQGFGKELMMDKKLPLHGEFKCYVADFECSVGVVGTGFYRAPEILHAVKNQSSKALTPILFSKAADVYSYGMTCYEILTGRIPLEELPLKKFDKVIDGYRPKFPSRVPRWMKDLLTKCWDKDPCKRPTFDEILCLVKDGMSKGNVLEPPYSKSFFMSLYSRAKGMLQGFLGK